MPVSKYYSAAGVTTSTRISAVIATNVPADPTHVILHDGRLDDINSEPQMTKRRNRPI
jgi:hypothetical protein